MSDNLQATRTPYTKDCGNCGSPQYSYESAMRQGLEEQKRLRNHMAKVADDLTAGRIDVHEAALRLKTYWNYM